MRIWALLVSEVSVLYVEDEIMIAIETVHLLETLGFQSVHVAHNLRTAEELAAKAQYDFALLDVNLGNGECTADFGIALRESGTQVVFVSGYCKSDLGARLGDFDFLEKPILRDALGQACLDLIEVNRLKKNRLHNKKPANPRVRREF